MRFSKLSLRAAALVLMGVVSSMAAQSSISPMTFGATSAEDETNQWNYLRAFKLWGSNGIDFGNRPQFFDTEHFCIKADQRLECKTDLYDYTGVKLSDLGAVGTAKGDLTSKGVDNNSYVSGWIDGPVIVGGSISTHHEMTLLTGPVRTSSGNISCGNNATTMCVGSDNKGACSYDKVPEIRSGLTVPTLSGATLSGTLNVSGRKMIECSGTGVCDFYYETIKFSNDSRLVVSIPEEGAAVRIFTKNLDLSGTHPQIVVRSYVTDENGQRVLRDLEQSEYQGNLLIYVANDIAFTNTDNMPVMGTIVSKGTITLTCNMIFAGQLIADKLLIGNEISAKNFVFKPFIDPPKLTLSATTATIEENNKWIEIGIGLDKSGDEDVTFDYCFKFNKTPKKGSFAEQADVGSKDTDHNFPVCNDANTSFVTATIPKNKKVAQNDANRVFIKALIDGIVETPTDGQPGEKLWLKVFNINGAEVSHDNYDASQGGFNIYIKDVDVLPSVTKDLVINVNEDTPHEFTTTEFNYKHSTSFAAVIFTVLPVNGTLRLGNKDVQKGQKVTVDQFSTLTYLANANYFGDDGFKYQVVGSGSGDNTSIVYDAKINVIPVNDRPFIDDNKVVFSVSEHPDKDAVLGTITPNDVYNEKSVDKYTFALVSSSSNDFSTYFELSSTGTVKVKGKVDLKKSSYTIKATVTDNAATEKSKINGPLTSEQFTILINVNNENDPPVIANQAFELPEKDPNGKNWTSSKKVGDVEASDPDGDALTYSIVTSGIPFEFKSGTNSLYVKDGSALDFETKPVWKFDVKVTESKTSDKLYATATITVTLTDVNEPPVVVESSEYSIDENSPKGTPAIGVLTIKDDDKVSGSYETLTYSLDGALTGAADVVTAKKNLNDIFELREVENSKGVRKVQIQVKNAALLDYEKLYHSGRRGAIYQVTIKITDSKSHSVSFDSKISINDVNEEPSAEDGVFVLNEHTPGGSQVCVAYGSDDNCTTPAKIEASDPDIYNVAKYGTLTYSISANNDASQSKDAKKFVVKEDGRLFTASSAEFEYDVIDGKTPQRKYQFYVTVSDGKFPKDVLVTINILNIKEPVPKTYVEGTVYLREDADATTPVDAFKKEDLPVADQPKFDALGDNIVYSIKEVSDLVNDLFRIDAEAGTIKIKDASLLDFETLFEKTNEFDVSILATGDGGATVEITKHIAVTDANEAPVIKESGPFSVNESVGAGALVGTIVASDPDNAYGVGKHPQGFDKLHYLVDKVIPVDGSSYFPFELDEYTGEITLKAGEKLHYIQQQTFKFVVRVKDSSMDPDNPPQSVTAEVTITVNDVNEPPEFRVLTEPYEVEENWKVGTEFGSAIVVYDEDAKDKDKLTISITDKDACTTGKCASDLFEVRQVGKTTDYESSFKVYVKKGLDYEALYKELAKDAIFNVTLTIEDQDGNTTSEDTKIRVTDVNEAPYFTDPDKKYAFEVEENTKTETSLGIAEAIDPDKYNTVYSTITFSIKESSSTEDASQFGIDKTTGEIYVINNANLNYEETSKYTFTVIVKDAKGLYDEAKVTVTVKDVDEGPKFDNVETKLYVDENTPKGTPVTLEDGTKVAITAVDDDCSASHVCKMPNYSLAAADGAPDDYKAFSIDADGFITVAADNVLNYEKQKKYVVRVVATDGKVSTLKDEVDITIYVRDVNDAPVFDKNEYKFDVDENGSAGEVVGVVFAEDEDVWSELTFEFADTKYKDKFKINPSTGRITTLTTLNFEDQEIYELSVIVTDNGSSKGFTDLSATTKVTIRVNNKPDDPIFVDDKKNYEVAENTAEHPMKDGTIACYEVSDEDEGQEETLAGYVIDVGGTDADRLFDADVKKDGTKYKLCLSVKNPSKFDYETLTHEHKIKVGVIDAQEHFAEVAKTIKIVDVNEMPIISGNASYALLENKKTDYVVGKLYSDDIDTSEEFTQNVFTAIGGDTELFTITEDGKIKPLRTFDYETEPRRTFELDVQLADKDSKNYADLKTTKHITITLKDGQEVPRIISEKFEVEENSEEGTVIGQIEAVDEDGDDMIFELVEGSYVDVSEDGKITVRKGAYIDYEKMTEFTITVRVKDITGLSSEKDILIKVIDVNEAPTIKDQKFEIPEDTPPGTKSGPIVATDPDKTKENNVLEFYPVEESSVFEIKKNGEIVLKDNLDYETQKSYTIDVRVVDPKGLSDVATITINVGNVVEKSTVEITRAEVRDSVYVKPDTLYVNVGEILVEWKQDGKTKTSLDSLKEGKNIIIKKYKDPSKDIEGADTLVVFYSTAAPVIEVDATKTVVSADNIYTVVEVVDKKDSSIYVNQKTKEVTVVVKDTTVSKKPESVDVTVVLDTIAVSNKNIKTLIDVTKSKPSLDKNAEGVSETPVNGNRIKVSYAEKVNGTNVTISYNVDEKGEIIKVPVFDEKGEKTMTEVIEVSTVVSVGGKDVVISYKADAETGTILYGDSEGNLMVDIPSSSSSKNPTSASSKDPDEADLKTGVGAFTVTYDIEGVKGNKATVSYVVDEKGKVVANEEGDKGFLVTYTYKNKYGNSADKSVFMVFDKLAPIVKINSPTEGQVLYANFVDVDWCIAIDGDEDNCVKQDTLNFQSLEKGVNTIKRIYRDKAGNETVAEVSVMMKKAKDVNIDLEKPMVIVSKDSVDKYYALNPPEKDQAYSVSIYNPTTQKESEVIVGNSEKAKKGSGEEPYPGYDGHIGPTLKIDLKLPIVSAVGGLATLDDIIINGHEVALEGVDAENSDKMEVADYVEKYCSDEFKENLGKDFSKATLYSSSARVTLWFYTTGGQFVDKYQFDYDLDDPEYVDKAGLVKFFFEMKPDINGELRDAHGRLYGTGPFIVKTKVEIRSKLRCTVPPVDGKAKFGDVIKSSDELLTRFGYRRPVLRGNEKKSSSGSKKSSSEKSSKKSSKKK